MIGIFVDVHLANSGFKRTMVDSTFDINVLQLPFYVEFCLDTKKNFVGLERRNKLFRLTFYKKACQLENFSGIE